MKNSRNIGFLTLFSRLMIGMIAMAALSGCAGYRLGTTLPPGVKNVYVPAFINETGYPQVDTYATRATIDEFQRDGTVVLTDEVDADAVIHATVTEYRMESLGYNPNDPKSTSEYRLWLVAKVIFTRKSNGEVLLDQKIRGKTEFNVAGDLSSAKMSALPDASIDLARHIVRSVVEYW